MWDHLIPPDIIYDLCPGEIATRTQEAALVRSDRLKQLRSAILFHNHQKNDGRLRGFNLLH